MKYLILFFISGFFATTLPAQEVEKTEADSVIYIKINTLPEGSYLDSVFVDFSGLWTGGLEHNEFNPCGDWLPDSLGGVPYIKNRLGISDLEAMWEYMINSPRDSLALYSDRTEDSDHSSSLRIDAKGWLVGPSNYDHFGLNRYTIKITEFQRVNWSQSGNCDQ